MEHDTVPVDLTSDLVVGAERYPYPNAVQQHERAVWRNKMLIKYLDSIGMAYRPVKTSIVTDWYKKYWFGDSVHGEKRFIEAGFTREQLVNLTTHHIVPNDLGGPDCIHNYHLMLRGVNSHFGSLFTKESIAWVGTEHAHVARAVSKFVKRQTADGVSTKKFDPFALSCPTRAVGKRRTVIHDDVVASSSSQRQRTGVVLEVNMFTATHAPLVARIEDVTSSVPTSTMDYKRREEIADAEHVGKKAKITAETDNQAWKMLLFRLNDKYERATSKKKVQLIGHIDKLIEDV